MYHVAERNIFVQVEDVTLLYRILQFNQRVITFIDKNDHLVRKLKFELRNFEFQR